MYFFFFFNDTATTEIYTLSLPTLFRSELVEQCVGVEQTEPLDHVQVAIPAEVAAGVNFGWDRNLRSEEHTSELQSRLHLVCRLLLEKKETDQTHDCARHLA